MRFQPSHLHPDLFRAGDLDALAMFDGADEGRGFVQAVMGTGVELGKTSTQTVDMKLASLEIGVVDRRYLQLATRRGDR